MSRKRRGTVGIRGEGGGVRGLHFSHHVMHFSNFAQNISLASLIRKPIFFMTNIENSAEKSTRGSSCVNLPPNIPFCCFGFF